MRDWREQNILNDKRGNNEQESLKFEPKPGDKYAPMSEHASERERERERMKKRDDI